MELGRQMLCSPDTDAPVLASTPFGTGCSFVQSLVQHKTGSDCVPMLEVRLTAQRPENDQFAFQQVVECRDAAGVQIPRKVGEGAQ